MVPEALNITIRSMLRSPWREVARYYRSACWLSSQSRDTEAEEILQGPFAVALAQASVIAPLTNDQLRAALEAEADRVANAVAVCELIEATSLRSSLSTMSGPARFDPARSPVLGRTGSGELPGIADLIEDMLLQDRHSR